MPTYEVETDQGTYQLELDAPVPEGEAGKQMLEELVHEQLSQGPISTTPREEFPVAAAVGDIGRGIVGGVRDFGQQFLDLPASIANTITEFVSPDAPGGPRRRMVPEVQAPQLPNPTGEPKSALERTVRTATPIGLDIAALAIPVGKSLLARRAAKRTPMMFEKGSVARDMTIPRRRPDLRLEPGSPASRPASRFDKPVPTVAEPSGILTTPPSQSARNLAKLFEFSADDIPKMTLERAMNARRRILTQIPDYPIVGRPGTPLAELLERLEKRILSFR